jgi:GT2 family glycosyltransferase
MIKISVVIPTIGEDTLEQVIINLNNGTLVPDEILICIPENFKLNINTLVYTNVKIIYTKQKGQVIQRIEGFIAAKNNYILQLDSDCLIYNDTLLKLFEIFQKFGDKIAVAPSMFGDIEKYTINRKTSNNLFYKISNYIIEGSVNVPRGYITKSGIPTFPIFEDREQLFLRSDWLPGGCVLHNKNNLVLNNYFPFPGKAYCEDIIHSYLLRKKGIKLYIHQNALINHIGLEVNIFKNSKILYMYIKRNFQIRKYFVKLINGNVYRFYLWFLIFTFQHIFKYTKLQFIKI